MSLRPSQLTLRIDASAPDESRRWQDGAQVAFLGGALTLRLDTALRDAARIGDELHLPLPPQATARQIRDRAEAWLRAAAEAEFASQLASLAHRQGINAPALRLSFSSRSHWAELDADGSLRCHWRLIEQPPATIADALARALRQQGAKPKTHAPVSGDLFAF